MKIDFDKDGGLVPAVIQDADTLQVLMLGYMDQEALSKTQTEGKVTFYSRSKQRLWTKGESSGHFLTVESIAVDCDQDTLLIKARPQGPTCHQGTYSCFGEMEAQGFLHKLDALTADRKAHPQAGSYTNHLFDKGIHKIAQKVGEEATEVVIEAVATNDERLLEESADLLYHLTVLLQARGKSITDVEAILKGRHQQG